MERRFAVEAKKFFFSTKESKIRLEERRKGFVGLILVGHRCASWLATTVLEASSSTEEDFAEIFCEERRSLSVSRGRNKAGRFLEVVAHVDDERKGVIWVPEARSGRGWRRFGVELRSWLAAVASFPGSPECAKLGEGSVGSRATTPEEEVEGSTVSSSDGERTASRGLQFLSELDLLPGTFRFEWGNEDRRTTLDCYEVEKVSPLYMACVSRPAKVMGSVKRKKMKKGLGLGLCGLGPKLKGKRAATYRDATGLGLGLGLFCLGLGMGKLGASVGLVPEMVSGPEASHQDTSEVSTTVEVQICPKEPSSSVAGLSDASSPGLDEQGALSTISSSGESVDNGSSPGLDEQGALSTKSSSGETGSSSVYDGSVYAGGIGSRSVLVHAELDTAGDETESFSSGSVETGRAFAGNGSESYWSGGGSDSSTATSDGSAFLHHREVWTVCISGDRPESAIPAGSPRLLDSKHLAFGLAKSQIWLLEWIEDRLKINEELKDEDHSVFLKAMVEDFRWINLVAREQGRLVVDEEDIRSLSIVACEGGWKVDEEEDARKVAWLIKMKDKLSLSIAWPV
jgi:hypothetical protein